MVSINDERKARVPMITKVKPDSLEVFPSQFKEGGQCTLDELLEINLDTKMSLIYKRNHVPQANEVYVNFLKENRDTSAWTLYRNQISVHHLSAETHKRPVK